MSILSVVIISKNNESSIATSIQSVSWANEIIVLDFGSKDNTEAICKLHKNTKFVSAYWENEVDVYNTALHLIQNEWGIIITSSDRFSSQLRDEIAQLQFDKADCFRIKRAFFYYQKNVSRLANKNDFTPVELVKKSAGKFISKNNSIVFQVKNKKLTLKEKLTYEPRKMMTYNVLIKKKKKDAMSDFSVGKFLSIPFHFLFLYILKGGFLKGKQGATFCVLRSFQTFYDSIF